MGASSESLVSSGLREAEAVDQSPPQLPVSIMQMQLLQLAFAISSWPDRIDASCRKGRRSGIWKPGFCDFAEEPQASAPLDAENTPPSQSCLGILV